MMKRKIIYEYAQRIVADTSVNCKSPLLDGLESLRAWVTWVRCLGVEVFFKFRFIQDENIIRLNRL